MLANLLLLCVSQSAGFDLAYSPAPREEYQLVQSSYAMQDGSLVEKVTFNIISAAEKTETGFTAKVSKMLTEHVFGEEKLDLPRDNQPMRNVEVRNANGHIESIDVDPGHAESYRLDRLTAYMPPKSPVKPGESWTRTLVWSEDKALPKIRYKFTLKSATTSLAKIAVSVEEFDTNNPLMATGLFTIALGKDKQRYSGGEWTTESAFMPGGSEVRFRLVQRIVPTGKN